MKIKIKSKSFYDFKRDGVTQSILQSFLLCPRQCKLAYVDGWTPYLKNDSLLFGELIHHVLEHFYDSSNAFPLPGTIKCRITDFEESLYKSNEPSIEVQEKNEVLFGKAEAVLCNYFQHYADDFEDQEWIFQEYTFNVPYRYGDGTIVPMRGKIDGAFLKINTKTDKKELWLIDHKTFSRDFKEELMLTLPADFQMWFYLYAATHLPQLKNYPLAGIIYNRIRVPGLRKTLKEPTVSDYVNKIYQDVSSRWEYYFDRIKMRIYPYDIAVWRIKQLDPIMMNYRQWVVSNYKKPGYFNPSQLITKYGISPFAKALISNNFDGLYKREKLFQEL